MSLTGKLFDPPSSYLSAPKGSLPFAGVSGAVFPGQHACITGTEAWGHVLLHQTNRE